jgi:hypothetical protein
MRLRSIRTAAVSDRAMLTTVRIRSLSASPCAVIFDRTSSETAVTGRLPAASRLTTRQSIDLASLWNRTPALLVIAAYSKSVPTAVAAQRQRPGSTVASSAIRRRSRSPRLARLPGSLTSVPEAHGVDQFAHGEGA